MVPFFLRIFDFLHERRRLCMASLTVIVCLLLLMMASLKYNENIFDFLPVSGNDQKAITLYQDITGGQRIIAMFKMKDSLDTSCSVLPEAVDSFAQILQSGYGSRHISEITTQVDFEKLMGITDFVYHNIPLMLADSDYVRMESIISSPETVGEQLANDVQMVMMPATGFFTQGIGNDPLGLFNPVMERLQAKQTAQLMEIDDGYIYTIGKKYAIAMLNSPYGATESANNSLLVSYVDSAAKKTMQAMPDVEVAFTGAPVIAVGNAEQIKTDSQWAISISITLILMLLVFAFRKVKNLLLIGAAIVFGWLFAMAFIAVMRSDVSLIVIGIGSMIIGIAVNYPLHFIAHTDHGGTIREVLKEMVTPLLIGNITTVGAFASLMPLDAPALRDLGFFAAFMLIGTILFVLIFLPHLVKRASLSPSTSHPSNFKSQTSNLKPQISNLKSQTSNLKSQRPKERLPFGRISSISPERHRWLLWVIFVLTLIFGYFSLGTSFDTNMHHINYMTDDQKNLLAELQASAGINDTANVYVVTEGDDWNQALDRRTRIAPLLDSLKQAGQLRQYSDVTTFICSETEQQRRIEKWNTFWNLHRDEVLKRLHEQAPQYGFSPDAFTAFEQILSATYHPLPSKFQTSNFKLQTSNFKDSSSPSALHSSLFSSSFSTSTGRCSVIDVIDASGKDIHSLEAALNAGIGNDGYAFDFVGMNSAIAESLSDDFNYIGFACGFIVFLFLWLSFGRIELSLLAFLPMAMGWLWILGMMNILGMQFNIVNVILATFIFGQGDDYTIFITDGLINEYAYKKKLLPSYKNSIVISALIMFIGMGSLIVARHPALHSLAEVTIVGMFTVVLMAWIVPPLIFNWLVKHNGVVRTEPITVGYFLRKLTSPFTLHPSPVTLHSSSVTTHDYHHYLIGKYTYKGIGVERETRRLLKKYDDFSQWIDSPTPSKFKVQSSNSELLTPNSQLLTPMSILNAGRGQFSLLLALVHPDIEIHSYAYDPDDAALAAAVEPMPANLHVHYCNDEAEARQAAAGTNILNLSELLS